MENRKFKNNKFYIGFIFVLLLLLVISINVLATTPDPCLPDAFGNVTCTDYNANATLNVDLRIANKHDVAQNLKLYTTQDHTNRNYVRNLNHWATGVDVTCISPYHSSAPVNQRAGTLITKRHVILASHFQIAVGDSMRFITNDNQVVARKVIAKYDNTDWSQSYPDVEILLLDSDVPPSITPCKFLPADYAKYLTNDGNGLPVLITDQEEKGIVSELSHIKSLPYSPSMFNLKMPTNTVRKALYEDVISGDSGNPAFLILNGELVILGTFTWGGSGSGTSLTYLANLAAGGGIPNMSIDDQIAKTDAKAGISTNYKISYFKFEAPTKSIDAFNSEIKLHTANMSLFIKTDCSELSEILITDISGRLLFKDKVALSDFKYNLPASGIYLIRILHKNQQVNYKIAL